MKIIFLFQKIFACCFVSFLEISNYINILAKGAGQKVFISERCNPKEYYSKKNIKSFLNLFFIKILYKKADLIIANSLGVKKSLVNDFSLDAKKIEVIYNPIDIKKIKELSQISLDEKYQKIFQDPVIINMGRLIPEKGQEYLIKAFSKVIVNKKEAKLVILGEGKLEKNLKNIVKSLNLEDNILFLGWQKNPFKFLKRSKVFVLSSLTEGFPNALVEAMACGIPVISSDCQSGPNEIIDNGKNGILVPVKDEKAFANKIEEILKDNSLAETISQKGQERSKDFSVDNIINQYEKLI